MIRGAAVPSRLLYGCGNLKKQEGKHALLRPAVKTESRRHHPMTTVRWVHDLAQCQSLSS